MNLRLFFTLVLSKLIIKVCRLFKRGGTTLAGKVALRIFPDVLKILGQGYRIIIITGTNGKTTTARIIGEILDENGIKYICNKSGANLLSGIVCTFIEASAIAGKSNAQVAVLEVDEAALYSVVDFIKPEILIITNFFRDQLDRFGELHTTFKIIHDAILKVPDAKLVLNADDSLCSALGRIPGREIIYYGINGSAYNSSEDIVNSDAMFCMFCKSRYEFDYRIYGHLGGFHCPSCGYRRPDPFIECVKVEEITSAHSLVKLKIGDESGLQTAKINLPGIYNIYNALAAAACGIAINCPVETVLNSLANFECGFGRMETIKVGEKTIKIILVKNPTGFNQVLSFLMSKENGFRLAFAINDRLADGIDISWLWDVDFEKLYNVADKIDVIFASGIRAEDMALRLKYAEIPTQKITIIKDYHELIQKGIESMEPSHTFYILPTYTAMLDIRKILKTKYKLKEFWK